MNDYNSVDEDDELLTAYLDGELNDEERRAVQHRLADDAKLRQRLAELQRAWDLLDELPDTPVNQEFTKSTLELVVQRVEKDVKQVSVTRDGIRLGWLRGMPLIVVLCGAGLFAGVAGGSVWRWNNNRSQTADLDVVANLSGLKVIDSLEVAQEFSKIPELGIDLSQVKLLANRIIPTSPPELSQRQRWIESMDAGQKAQLWRNQQERNRLPQSDFRKLRELANQISREPQAESLNRAVAVAGVIYDLQSSEEQNALLGLPAADRAHRLRQLFYAELGQWYADQLKPNEKKEIEKWFAELVRRNAILRNAPFRNAIARNALLQERVGELIDGDYLLNEAEFIESLSTLVSSGLSEMAKNILENVHRDALPNTLGHWVNATMDYRPPDYEDLWQLYDGKWNDDQERERLDLRPYTELESQLRNMFIQKRRMAQEPKPRTDPGKERRKPQ